MVAIRRLQPTVKIAMPAKVSKPYRSDIHHTPRVLTVRRIEDFPPPTPQPTPCRLWQGSIDDFGYGQYKYNRPSDGKRVSIGMHRWVMQQYVGRPLGRREYVMHRCDNPLCYRFDHLQLGSAAANNKDMTRKGRLVHVANRSPGERNGSAKLTGSQVAAIRRRWRDGLKLTTIAKEYKISTTQVRRIVDGIAWATGPTRDLLAEARERIAKEQDGIPS